MVSCTEIYPEAYFGSRAMDTLAWLSNNDAHTRLSPLGAEMLRMYLSGKKDGKLIAKVGAAIRKSETFHKLSDNLQAKLTAQFIQNSRPPTSDIVLKEAQHLLDEYREIGPDGQSRKIYFDKEGLQPVVGGVTKLNAEAVEITPTLGGFRFKLQIRIGDSYDFNNSRKGEYDRFRKQLAALFRNGERSAFWNEYLQAFYGFHDGINSGNAFASFMFAVEQGGCFKPIDWDVLLPIEGTIEAPARIRIVPDVMPRSHLA